MAGGTLAGLGRHDDKEQRNPCRKQGKARHGWGKDDGLRRLGRLLAAPALSYASWAGYKSFSTEFY
jgi:hypothetical protein